MNCPRCEGLLMSDQVYNQDENHACVSDMALSQLW